MVLPDASMTSAFSVDSSGPRPSNTSAIFPLRTRTEAGSITRPSPTNTFAFL
jgi:hypothetical protein